MTKGTFEVYRCYLNVEPGELKGEVIKDNLTEEKAKELSNVEGSYKCQEWITIYRNSDAVKKNKRENK